MSRHNPSTSVHEITHFTRANHYELTKLSSEEDDGPNFSSRHEHDLESLPPLASFQVGAFDLFFNIVVFGIILLEFGFQVGVLVLHYLGSGLWASGITFIVLAIGGVALLGTFWGIPSDTLSHVYGRSKVVRVLVNSFPHFAIIITSFESTRVCMKCMHNPTAIPQYIKLDELTRTFLKVQGFACSAPMAVLQLVNLILAEQRGFEVKECVLLVTVVLNLTTMMLGNLPGKYENSEELPKAAYIPGSRVFVGLRMSSTFGSRTMSLAYLYVSFLCIGRELLGISEFLSALIPISVVVLPRVLITVVQYIHGRVKGKKRPRRFLSVLLGYIATVFFPFGDPPWVFWYIHVETFVYLVFGATLFFVLECGVSVVFNSVYCGVFAVLYFVVPFLVPCLRVRARKT